MQYKTASLKPPHLKAICPWEGVSDLYKDWFFHNGVMEEGFTPFFSKRVSQMGDCVDMHQAQLQHETRDDFWKDFAPDLKEIRLPMLNCVSYSCQMFHSSGSYRAYEKVSSKDKWLYTHRNGEWTEYYSTEVQSLMLKFFDYYLKEINNGMDHHPKVRLEIREFGHDVKEVRYEDQFPPKEVVWTKLYLNNQNMSLKDHPQTSNESVNFQLKSQNLIYTYNFPYDVEIVGPMKLSLNIELEDTHDANLFVGIQKFHNGKEVNFEGVYGFANDMVARTCLRVALRTVNKEESSPYTPEYDFDTLKPLKKGEKVTIQLKFSPSATYYRKGDELRLVIQGKYFINGAKIHQPFKYKSSTNGSCIIHGSDENVLLMPIIPVKKS